ncbi:MAG TPA: PKD domain-containing protein, partial [Atribacteraceae bacterium]|nr:PKD domain-containing protein [Atribacteraceae bacterium]
MLHKNFLLSSLFLLTGVLLILASCTPSPQFGSPGASIITGEAAMPAQCFSCEAGEANPPAYVLVYGGESGKLEATSTLNCDGTFSVATNGQASSVVYVVRQNVTNPDQYMVLKKGIDRSSGDIGLIDAHTTAQVMIWEQVNVANVPDFTVFNAAHYSKYEWRWSFDADLVNELSLGVEDIPGLAIEEAEQYGELLSAVQSAIDSCSDPQLPGGQALALARLVADALFGGICRPCGPAFGSPGGNQTPPPTNLCVPVPKVNFDFTVLPPSNGNGMTVKFINKSTPLESTENPITYTWDFGDESTSNELNPTHTYDGNGPYQVTLTASNLCGSDTVTLQVERLVQLFGSLSVTKVEEPLNNGGPAGGWEFKLLGSDDNDVATFTLSTQNNWTWESGPLPLGTYTIVETTSLSGWTTTVAVT